MSFTFTRFPAELRYHSDEGKMDYSLVVFGELKLSWGIELYIFRMSVRQEDGVEGVGELRLLPKDEFNQFFEPFKQVPESDLH